MTAPLCWPDRRLLVTLAALLLRPLLLFASVWAGLCGAPADDSALPLPLLLLLLLLKAAVTFRPPEECCWAPMPMRSAAAAAPLLGAASKWYRSGRYGCSSAPDGSAPGASGR